MGLAKVNKAQKWRENLKFTPSLPPSFEGENCINYIYAINVGLLNHTGLTSTQRQCSDLPCMSVSEKSTLFSCRHLS